MDVPAGSRGSSERMPFAGLILDFGEVLTRPQPAQVVERMARLAGLAPDRFSARYWQHRLAYDGGLPAAEYWQRVLEGVDGLPEGVVAELIEADALSWSDFRDEVWDLARAFRARGGRTAMLSNGVAEIVARVRVARPLETWFDTVVVSCEIGRCKPDPEIYRVCVERLGVPAELTLFVDDRPENLAGAESIGLRTLHFTGDGSVPALRRLLEA